MADERARYRSPPRKFFLFFLLPPFPHRRAIAVRACNMGKSRKRDGGRFARRSIRGGAYLSRRRNVIIGYRYVLRVIA